MRHHRSFAVRLLAACLVTVLPGVAAAERVVRIPEGTTVFCELDEQVTSKKKHTSVGDIVRAHVWRDVRIDGRVVIKAGTPVPARVSMVKPAKIAGRKGDVNIDALSTHSVDGNEVLLDGGYDKSGKSHKALAWSLFAVVAWPLVFIKGKQAVLDPGTVFDSTVQAEVAVAVVDAEPFKLKIGVSMDVLEVAVLYDEMNPQEKQVLLPLVLRSCADNPLSSVTIVAVNDKPVPPLLVTLGETTPADDCRETRATVDLKKLAKHFSKGINRFTVDTGAGKAEVILEIEL